VRRRAPSSTVSCSGEARNNKLKKMDEGGSRSLHMPGCFLREWGRRRGQVHLQSATHPDKSPR
jgi:hypothetical protein